MIGWFLCLIGIHVAWPELDRKKAIGFECRRCRATVFTKRKRKTTPLHAVDRRK